MRKMKDSGISWMGEIPEHWEIRRVKHAFFRKNEKAMQDSPIVLSLARTGVRERDISNNEGQIAESYYNYNPVEINDLLINPMDLYSGANCSISKVRGVISPAYINLRYKENIEPEFYDYYFKLQYWLMAFFSYGKGVSFENRWTLNAETLMNYPIILPPCEEQRIISDYLNSKCMKIDNIIDRQETIIQKIKEYKLSLYSEQIANSFGKEVALGKIITSIEQGWSPSPSEKKDDNGWNVLTLAAVKYGQFGSGEVKEFIGDQEKCERLVLKDGDFLLTRSNTRELVGQVCIVNNVKANTIFSDLIYRLTFNLEYIDPEYALYYFQSPQMRQQISRDAHGSSSTMVKITHKNISNWTVMLPSIETQKEIVSILKQKEKAILNEIAKRECLIEKLVEYKKSLIYEVVTGKKEVL